MLRSVKRDGRVH